MDWVSGRLSADATLAVTVGAVAVVTVTAVPMRGSAYELPCVAYDSAQLAAGKTGATVPPRAVVTSIRIAWQELLGWVVPSVGAAGPHATRPLASGKRRTTRTY